MKQTNTLFNGASISGLASAACFQKRGIEYTIIEKETQIATPWRNHYERLHSDQSMTDKKDQSDTKTNPARKVRYELYTNEDFSDDQKNILFSIFMRNGQKTIFDSPLATVKIKDIPDSNHRIIIEKLLPDNDTSTLVAGFNYQIENVGFSWYLETFTAGDTFKVLRYPLR
jgi:hypothetical protein